MGEVFTIAVPLTVVLMSILGGTRHWAGPAIGAVAITCLLFAFTGGNMFQTWSVADTTREYFGVPTWITGVILVGAISLTGWVQYARTVRGTTLVERNKEYVQAARVTGVAPWRIMLKHVLPNVLGPVMVLATIQVATAIITEATLSFLGVGVPPTQPSLGTLIRVGNDFLFSGEWWITVFPGAMLVLIALSVNLLGDWLRDALNPRLK